ncbi:hypothetical protein [Demetria terragena]|uniref:hypothetical protein n=1 Tax=Demetria terragena TaxID=63959 RepID=UPI0004755E5C|nr:hypothetical protein [Demetria terragena]
MSDMTGVVFPTSGETRSTGALGRAVVAAALEPIDPVGASAARAETGWRREYLKHFKRLVEAAGRDPEAAVTSARAGLAALHEQMRWVDESGEHPLSAAVRAGTPPATETIEGIGQPETELSIPLRGNRLRGDDLRRQLDRWVEGGVMEPGARDALGVVMDNPDWLRFEGKTLVVLGAGAEMGPMRSALRWGATVAAVDLPRSDIWDRVMVYARTRAGRLLVPTRTQGDARLEERAGLDVLHDPASVVAWLGGIPGPLVLGNYVYADGGTNLRLSAATEAISMGLRQQRDDLALAFLATPTDVFQVPEGAVEYSNRSYQQAGGAIRRVRTPLRVASRGRLLRRQYAPLPEGPAISDTMVPQQGPNYLLAKRIHRWRASVAAADGQLVSMSVAPPTRTQSVLKNRALAAAYAGAHRFGVEIFEPATANTVMAALLAYDLHTGGVSARQGTPFEQEGVTAVHGGTWRVAYDPRSALGIAALLGLGAARH